MELKRNELKIAQKMVVPIPPKPNIIKMLPTMRLSMISPFRLKYFLSRETNRMMKIHHNNAPTAIETIPAITEKVPSASGLN